MITLAVRAFAVAFVTVFAVAVAAVAGWDAADRVLRPR